MCKRRSFVSFRQPFFSLTELSVRVSSESSCLLWFFFVLLLWRPFAILLALLCNLLLFYFIFVWSLQPSGLFQSLVFFPLSGSVLSSSFCPLFSISPLFYLCSDLSSLLLSERRRSSGRWLSNVHFFEPFNLSLSGGIRELGLGGKSSFSLVHRRKCGVDDLRLLHNLIKKITS